MLTTVASLDVPLTVTLTLSPALNCDVAAELEAGDVAGAVVAAGLAAAGVAAGLFSLPLFAFSGLDSHALKANASAATAKIFIVMIVPPKYASFGSVVQFRR
jgi:hypothetical protein